MPLPKFSKGERRKITIFFSSLAGAVFLWLFYSLSGTYTYPIKLGIQFTNKPNNQQFRALQTDSIQASVQGSGWQLIFGKLKTETPSIKISLKNLDQNRFIDLKSQQTAINKQLASGQKIISIKPDTLFFDQSELISKKVPVKLLYQIRFQPSYGFAAAFQLSPAYVTLIGKAEDLKTINCIETEILRKSEVNTDLQQWLNLKSVKGKKVMADPQQILVKVPVSGYTEKVLNLDILVKNNQNQQLKLFPTKVKVTFSTALSNYPIIKPDDFEAYVDLSLWQSKKISSLPIKFGRLPNFIKILKIEPQTVDFIINP